MDSMTHQPPESEFSALAADPLGWWLAEHERHRALCALMESVARSPDYQPEAVARLITFLHADLPLHAQEEEEDWFPRLRARARRGDDFEGTITATAADHGRGSHDIAAILPGLRTCEDAKRSPFHYPDLAHRMIEMARRERQHLAMENAVLIPIARIRLTAGDLQAVARSIAARRLRGDKPQSAQ